MFQNYDVIARDEAFLDYMRQAYRCAYRSVCSSAYSEDQSGKDIARVAGYYLMERLEKLEKDGFEKWEKLYSTPSWFEVSGDKLHGLFDALAEAARTGEDVVLPEKSTMGVKKQKTAFVGVNEMLYSAGITLRDRISEFNPPVSMQEMRGMIFGIMRQTVEELSEVPGDGVVQSYAPVLQLSPAEAVKKFERILVQCEEQKTDESDVMGMVEQIRRLFIDSVNRWADEMKEACR